MSQGSSQPKDVWDKLEKISTFLASVVLATVTFAITKVVDARQAERDAALKAAQLRTEELSAVQGFIDHLAKGGAEADVAILAISVLGNDSLAVRLGALARRDSALQELLPHLARMNQVDLIGAVLEIGADPDAPDVAGSTPLMLAAGAGAQEALKTLLQYGADPNARSDRTGWTPLMFAAARGRVSGVAELVDQGADIDATNEAEQSALWLAAQTGQLEVVGALLGRGATVDLMDSDGWTPLFVAASLGHAEAVVALGQSGADVNHVSVDGETPLMAAAEGGHVEAVQRLLEAGGDASLTNGNGETAMEKARRLGHVDVVNALGAHDGR